MKALSQLRRLPLLRCRYLLLSMFVLTGCGQQRSAPEAAVTPPASSSAVPNGAASAVGSPSGLPDFAALVKRAGPAVVNVVTSRGAPGGAAAGSGPGQPGDPLNEYFRKFMPDPPHSGPGQRGQGLGSGFIISQDGYVLTNAHVVAGADEVTVRLADAKREFKAKVVGADRRTDVALLKVEATGLPTLPLGNSGTLEVGQWVAAIGSPFGFANTITAGIVSAKGRTLPDESFVPFIQTDVAVNPGNSGGPLLNLKGEVVGINSLIYSGSGGYMGLSFAIPIEVASDIVKQLQATGKVTRGRLGVSLQEMTRELAASFKLERPTGALLARIEPGSPAQKAGLLPGDVILKYNGKALDDATELSRLVAGSKPGEAAALEVWREGASRQVQVTIGEFPAEQMLASAPAASGKTGNRLGIAVSVLPPPGRKAMGIDFGLVVEAIDPAADVGRIRRGDVIAGINNTEFSSVEQFNQIVDSQKPGSAVALLVRRGNAALYVAADVMGPR